MNVSGKRFCFDSFGEKNLALEHLLWDTARAPWVWAWGLGGGRGPGQQMETCCSHSWASGRGLERTENADPP